MSNIMTTLKGYCPDSGFEELLNTNRDALPLVNGVILLQSGELVPHHPKVGFLEAKPSFRRW
jgi:phage/plasmid-associated DNA primase